MSRILCLGINIFDIISLDIALYTNTHTRAHIQTCCIRITIINQRGNEERTTKKKGAGRSTIVNFMCHRFRNDAHRRRLTYYQKTRKPDSTLHYTVHVLFPRTLYPYVYTLLLNECFIFVPRRSLWSKF